MAYVEVMRLYAGVSLLGLLAAAPAYAQEVNQNAPAAAETGGLEEIVVTAQKRQQSAQDVPISITALSPAALETNRIANVSDLNAIAPNLTVRESQGGAGVPGVTLRGAFGYGVSAGTDRDVALYIDGVFVGGAQGAIFDLADIEQIEVLKGPQGTLFGRASTAGAINITTHSPKGTFAVRQELSYGNFNLFRSKTRIDLPAFGPFAAAITYTHTERDGDTRNLLPGVAWDYTAVGEGIRTSSKRLGDQNIDAVLASLRFDDGGDIRAIYKFDYTDNQGTPAAIGTIRNNLAILGPQLAGLYAFQDPAITTPVSKRRPDAVNNGFHTPFKNPAWGHNLTLDWQASDAISIKNIVADRRVKTQTTSSLQGIGTLVANVVPFVPFGLFDANSSSKYHQFSNELQVNVTTDPVTLTAGYLHFTSRVRAGSFTDGLPNVLSFFTGTTILPVNGFVNDRVRVKSDALFAQAEVHVTPEIDLVGGYRMTWDRKRSTSGAPVNNVPFFVDTKYKQSTPSYLIGANYQPSRNLLLYAKYSTGYLSGGALAGLNYERERAYSYEAGVKADWLDRRLRTNLSVFDVRYKDIQISSSGISTFNHVLAQSGFAPGTPGYAAAQARFAYLPSFGVTAETIGNGHAKGFEAEVTALPVDGLTLSGSLGYTDFKFTKILPGIATFGTYFPNFRPKWTSTLSAQYESGPLFDDARLLLRVDGNYQSKNLTFPDIPASDVGLFTVDAHWMVNARAALRGLSIGSHSAEIAVWAKNLTDSDRVLYAQDFRFTTAVTYELQRTFGVDLKFDF